MSEQFSQQFNYRGYAIMKSPDQWPPYSVCFNLYECDYGDYETLAAAKRAIDRELKEER